MRVLDTLERFFSHTAPVEPGDVVVAAFSGGTDSTALLWGLSHWAALRDIEVLAAHLDHGADPGSAGRADAARRIATRLGVPMISERRSTPTRRRKGESPEEAARRVRYAFLEQVRQHFGARWIVTAHHADDQVETVLLRILQGSGLEGLGGIRPVRGPVVRPLLDWTRRELAEVVAGSRLEPVDDPTNRRPGPARNRVRHHLLPLLVENEPNLPRLLISVSSRCRGLRSRLDEMLLSRLDLRKTPKGSSANLRRLSELPPPLHAAALARLHRVAGLHLPPPGSAVHELSRQMMAAHGSGHDIGCDCGSGWRWRRRGERLHLEPAASNSVDDFTYTLEAPGEIVVDELSCSFRLTRGATVEPWMFRSSARRAGLALPLEPGDSVEVRNRRPGDRLRPLGAPGRRRLKEVLIDRRVDRETRDRLPLLLVGGRIAWVPGVTLDERFRLRDGSPVWIAEILPLPERPFRNQTRLGSVGA